jgi:hypothetical protein
MAKSRGVGQLIQSRISSGHTESVGSHGRAWGSTTRNLLIYDDFLMTFLENIINMHDL